MGGKRSRFRRHDIPPRSKYAGDTPINSCDMAAPIDVAAASGKPEVAIQKMERRAIKIQPS
jgi:hypothetical protein